MKRMSTRVRLTLALLLATAGFCSSLGVYGHSTANSQAQHHYLAGDLGPWPPTR
jgi:hypothetical protein